MPLFLTPQMKDPFPKKEFFVVTRWLLVQTVKWSEYFRGGTIKPLAKVSLSAFWGNVENRGVSFRWCQETTTLYIDWRTENYIKTTLFPRISYPRRALCTQHFTRKLGFLPMRNGSDGYTHERLMRKRRRRCRSLFYSPSPLRLVGL